MDRFLVVRLKLHSNDQAPSVIRAIQDCLEGFHDSRLVDDYLLVRVRPSREVDGMLIDLQTCLEQNDFGSGAERRPEIVETWFPNQEVAVDLPGNITLDPGFSFGSGSHPSTRLAMSLLEHLTANGRPGRVLDVGCGSGILALLAAGFGAQKVLGVEIDPESVITARRNVEANDLAATVTISDQPLADVPGKFDLILANLTASVFYNLAEEIDRLTAARAHMIVSGLQGRQAGEMVSFLGKRGWVKERQMNSDKWRALLLARNTLHERL